MKEASDAIKHLRFFSVPASKAKLVNSHDLPVVI